MAATDLVTIAEATAYMSANGTGSSPLLDGWITAASDALDDMCGPIVQRTVTGETHNLEGATRMVRLDLTRVVSCSSVVEYDAAGNATTLTAETVTTKPADGYRLWNGRELERRQSGGACLWVRTGAVVVTYTAGRFASTSVVSQRFKKAAMMLVGHLFAVEHGTGANSFGDVQVTPTGFAVPRRVIELLGSEVEQGIVVA